jgi:hypothetical protein
MPTIAVGWCRPGGVKQGKQPVAMGISTLALGLQRILPTLQIKRKPGSQSLLRHRVEPLIVPSVSSTSEPGTYHGITAYI